jgi:hypothetical protein
MGMHSTLRSASFQADRPKGSWLLCKGQYPGDSDPSAKRMVRGIPENSPIVAWFTPQVALQFSLLTGTCAKIKEGLTVMTAR